MLKLFDNTVIPIGNDKQFKQLAFQYYENPSCISFAEFENDVRMFTMVASTIEKFANNSKSVNCRQLLNRMIIIHNNFGKFTSSGLMWKTKRDYWKILYTFLYFLQYLRQEDIELQLIDKQLLANLNAL